MTKDVMITTFDNPYNPFDDFDSWFLFDVEKGYCSLSYLGRIARTSEQLSEEENFEEIERAIDEIISYNEELYTKVYRNREESDKMS